MCFDMQPLYPPTQKAKVLNNQLYTICYCEIAYAIIRFCATDYLNGIMELLLCLILWCGIKQMQFCQLLMYMIICMIFWVFAFVYIGDYIQHNRFHELKYYTDVAIFVVQCIGIIFYIVAISFAFQGYKEYKAIQYQSIGGGVMSMFRQQQQGSGGGRGRDNSDGSSNQNSGGGRGQYAPQGQYQPPPYQGQNQNQNQNQNNNASGNRGGGFQAFQGRGVRLG